MIPVRHWEQKKKKKGGGLVERKAGLEEGRLKGSQYIGTV